MKYGLKETISPNFFSSAFPLRNQSPITTIADLAISTWKLFLDTVQGLLIHRGLFPTADMTLTAQNETLLLIHIRSI